MPSDHPRREERRVLTVPNLLSLARLAMIPLIIWLYAVRGEFRWAAAVLFLSGVTDVADGFIARRFHMISDVGKILDPVADKLTQLAVLLCLPRRFALMLLPLAALSIKEIFCAVTGLAVIRRTGAVPSAQNHGKLATVLLYATAFVHFIWTDIPDLLSTVLILACTAALLCSMALYGVRNLTALRPRERGDADPVSRT